MGRPCVTGLWKYDERSNDIIYDEGRPRKKWKESVKELFIRRNLSGLRSKHMIESVEKMQCWRPRAKMAHKV